MICINCNGGIHESPDTSCPFVHDGTGNAFCDVFSPADAVKLAGLPNRPEATNEVSCWVYPAEYPAVQLWLDGVSATWPAVVSADADGRTWA